MNKDILHLTSLYEQILLTEDSELGRFGFSTNFVNSLFTKYDIPHNAKFTKLTKIPSLADLSGYTVVVARLKGKEGGIVIARDSIRDFDGKELGKLSSNHTFVTIKSAVDKDSIYGMVGNSHIETREESRDKKFLPLMDDIFNLLQTKFGKVFREKIKNLQDYIYTNIRTFKHKRVVKRGRNLGADILEVMHVLTQLTDIDTSSRYNFDSGVDGSWRMEYYRVLKNTMERFLSQYGYDPGNSFSINKTHKNFVTHFNERPSYVQLAKFFLQSLDAYEDEVLYYIHSDYFRNIPSQQHEIKLKELKKKELTDAAFQDMDLADMYNL